MSVLGGAEVGVGADADVKTETARVRVVVLTGAPGAGKTEAGRRLVRRYQVPAALIDTDAVADVYPWQADERLYAVLGRNLRACLDSYLEWGARVVVLSGVMLPGRTLDQFADLLADPRLEWVFYGLRARPEELAARILADTKVQEADGRLSWSHLDEEVATVPGIRQLETGALTAAQVVDLIAAAEAADLPPGALTATTPPGPLPVTPTGTTGTTENAAAGARSVTPVSAADARSACADALGRAGFPPPVAEQAAAELVAAETDGQPSHGLLRVPEYVAAVAAGELCPTARPRVHRTGERAVLVDGGRAPGVLVRRLLATELGRAAQGGPVVVGLRDSGHLGRLAPLGREVAGQGLVLLGFVNFCGAGRKVAPAGGTDGRWATNPLLLACPAPPGAPLVLDMSTSAAAEGVVRAALLAGTEVPPGLLIGTDGAPVTDPRLLYTEPPRAALAPLGGIAEHKGHALAALVETLAGAVAGAGHAAAPQGPGNGGLFVAFRVDALGRSGAAVGTAVSALEQHLLAGPRLDDQRAPRLPGRAVRPPHTPDLLTPPTALWQRIRQLASTDLTKGIAPCPIPC
ncbi:MULTISPECIES: Ldh family oxidoreductase [unclassified Kitasatospora]|uniref:Ldh family oxidoreductase n=1 Tax=unclassified Kitasatospora TaxID=2633591 RepID=UPI000A3E613B|nr:MULTISPECIES: Ldh family oxidoreductase [unclassified Kitasatospora]